VIVGLISDTHGLLREAAIRALQGSVLIIHAGDVGKPEILDRLGAIAPVVAVRGNIDQAPGVAELPPTAVAKAGRAKFFVLHDVHDLAIDPKAAGYRVVISGHSHKPACAERGGVFYINPGSAGPRRFRLPVTLARIDLRPTPWKIEFIDLETEQGTIVEGNCP
jgi:putative phosphoesterase